MGRIHIDGLQVCLSFPSHSNYHLYYSQMDKSQFVQ